MTSLAWFRDDLRTLDNPALVAAVERGGPIVAVYVLDEESEGIRELGGATRWWLHHSLTVLRDHLDDLGVPLVLRRGAAGEVIPEVVEELDADLVTWNRRYGGPERAVDTALKERLTSDGVDVHSYAASLLHEPWEVRTGGGTPYKVFTPFWKACVDLPAPRRAATRGGAAGAVLTVAGERSARGRRSRGLGVVAQEARLVRRPREGLDTGAGRSAHPA